MKLSNEKALRIALGIMLASGIGSIPWAGGKMNAAHDAHKAPAVRKLTWQEIDAIGVEPVAATKPERPAWWADPKIRLAVLDAQRELAEVQQQALGVQADAAAYRQVAEEIRAAAEQSHQDNLTALIWSHSR